MPGYVTLPSHYRRPRGDHGFGARPRHPKMPPYVPRMAVRTFGGRFHTALPACEPIPPTWRTTPYSGMSIMPVMSSSRPLGCPICPICPLCAGMLDRYARYVPIGCPICPDMPDSIGRWCPICPICPLLGRRAGHTSITSHTKCHRSHTSHPSHRSHQPHQACHDTPVPSVTSAPRSPYVTYVIGRLTCCLVYHMCHRSRLSL